MPQCESIQSPMPFNGMLFSTKFINGSQKQNGTTLNSTHIMRHTPSAQDACNPVEAETFMLKFKPSYD